MSKCKLNPERNCVENGCAFYNHELTVPCTYGDCPHGGDTSNDCEGCINSGDYHFKDGECVLRRNDDN